MTKVYVVTVQEWDGDSWERDVVTVYSSREKAEAHIKGLDIDEYYGYKLHHFIDEYEVE